MDIEPQRDNLKPQAMPDVSSEACADLAIPLEKVGMSAVEMPIMIKNTGEANLRIPAKIDAYVDLIDPNSKGIHMSRLYAVLREALGKESLSTISIGKILQHFISSQKGLSGSSFIKISFELPLERKSLISGNLGWRYYPATLEGKLDDTGLSVNLGLQVAYSSTCPCSAALSKQIIKNKFTSDFAGNDLIKVGEVKEWLESNSLLATPHAQRSYSDLLIAIDSGDQVKIDFIDIINLVEGALKTPVQAAVKREDEQEFAKLNGQNLMFCEDACRRIKVALNTDTRIIDYKIRVDHQESLHSHNAVSYGVKGVADGFKV